MTFSEYDAGSTLQHNDTTVILTSNHPLITRLKQQETQHKTKKKKGRFFEQFCKYLSYHIYLHDGNVIYFNKFKIEKMLLKSFTQV